MRPPWNPRSVVALAAGLAVALVACSSSPARPAQATTPAPDPAGIEAFIPTAEHFVEAHRGLRFEHPVTVTLLGDAAFRARLMQDSRVDTAALHTTARDLQALHLLAPGVDLAKALEAALGGAVSGFYDSKAKALFVRGVAATPYVRQVLVHELTHAVQDQHLGIDRPQLDNAPDESASGFQALVEGDAVRIEDEYHASLNAADQARADREESDQAKGIDTSTIPHVLLELLVFPYQFGPDFTRAVVATRGQAGLDAAFSRPPTTTAEIMEPQRFLDGQQPVAVATPGADGTSFDRGVLGEFGLALLAERATAAGAADDASAATALRAWDGDRYVAWSRGSTSCLRVAVAADSAEHRTTLTSLLRGYARTASGVQVDASGAGPVVMTSCG